MQDIYDRYTNERSIKTIIYCNTVPLSKLFSVDCRKYGKSCKLKYILRFPRRYNFLPHRKISITTNKVINSYSVSVNVC